MKNLLKLGFIAFDKVVAVEKDVSWSYWGIKLATPLSDKMVVQLRAKSIRLYENAYQWESAVGTGKNEIARQFKYGKKPDSSMTPPVATYKIEIQDGPISPTAYPIPSSKVSNLAGQLASKLPTVEVAETVLEPPKKKTNHLAVKIAHMDFYNGEIPPSELLCIATDNGYSEKIHCEKCDKERWIKKADVFQVKHCAPCAEWQRKENRKRNRALKNSLKKAPEWSKYIAVDEVLETLSFGDNHMAITGELLGLMPDAYDYQPAGENDDDPTAYKLDKLDTKALALIWGGLLTPTKNALELAYKVEHGDM